MSKDQHFQRARLVLCLIQEKYSEDFCLVANSLYEIAHSFRKIQREEKSVDPATMSWRLPIPAITLIHRL